MAELLNGTDLDVKQKMFSDTIIKSGSSLLTIINDILDFSKIDAGQLELAPVPFALAEAVEDVATLLSTAANEKQLELVVRIDPSLPSDFIGYVGHLRQIITNLMGNAVKFTDSGEVYVNATGMVKPDNSADLQFSIKDTGSGIPKDKCRTIYEKFSQMDASATRRKDPDHRLPPRWFN